jgi:hypothetical protein
VPEGPQVASAAVFSNPEGRASVITRLVAAAVVVAVMTKVNSSPTFLEPVGVRLLLIVRGFCRQQEHQWQVNGGSRVCIGRIGDITADLVLIWLCRHSDHAGNVGFMTTIRTTATSICHP